jgi:hypothetical protein
MENLEQHLLEKNRIIKKMTKKIFRNHYNYKLIKEIIKDKEYWNFF